MATDEQKAIAYDYVTTQGSMVETIDIPMEQKAERWDRRAVKYRNVRDGFVQGFGGSAAWCACGRLRSDSHQDCGAVA